VPRHVDDAAHDIVVVIRRYIHAHPDAADTIDGIHRWWLLPTLQDESRQLVADALDSLVQEGVMRQVTLEDGRVIYSSARRPA
jgi:hypothetical protein